MPKTETADYIVGQGGTVLYSWYRADPPVPTRLYTRRNEQTISGAKYYEWTPNVRFLGDSEVDKEDLDIGTVTRAVERPTGTTGDILPKLGMVGKNDCANFATALQALISDSGEVRARGRKIARIESLSRERDEVVVAVGDMMKHYFPNGGCNYHAATVVAKEGNDLVTLEAHVSKDLKKPEFHIRKGVAGFVQDNRQRTDQVDIEPAEANKQVAEVFDLYRLITDPRADKYKKLFTINKALAATKNVKGQIRNARSPNSALQILFLLAIIVVVLSWILGAF